MTGWIPDVVPDETIESAWGNEIRDRTVTPFTNAAERDASIPTPKVGMTVWMMDTNVMQVYAAGAWQTVVTSKSPLGYLGHAQLTATTATISTDAVVAGLGPLNITHVANRRILAEAFVPLVIPTANGAAEIRIMAGATQIQIGRATTVASINGGGISARVIYTPAAGAVAYTLRANTSAGTIQLVGTATSPIWIGLTDLGGV